MPAIPSTLSLASKIKRPTPLRSPVHRGTLRDLYLSGLVSVFRRPSVLRVWEPLRGTPAQPDQDKAH
jgi:hypothetical protein